MKLLPLALLLAVVACGPNSEFDRTIDPSTSQGYGLYIHCGAEWLGRWNGTYWRAEPPDRSDFALDEWQAVATQDTVWVSLALSSDGQVITATANGRTITYAPSAEESPKCI